MESWDGVDFGVKEAIPAIEVLAESWAIASLFSTKSIKWKNGKDDNFLGSFW